MDQIAETDHFIIANGAAAELKIKRSGFIASVMPVMDKAAAEQFILSQKEKHYNATHNCFAYRIDEKICRYSDDGEPSGTAGQPIMAMIDKYNLIQCAVVVTRYYGGIKLGAGGLVRAYSECAETAIQKCKLEKFVRYHFLKIQYPYNFSRQMHYIASKYEGVFGKSEFSDTVTAAIKIPEKRRSAFEAAVLGVGAGKIQIIVARD